jgi:hypothetical protein
LFVAHCAFSFGEKNGELYQLTTLLRKLHLLSETAYLPKGRWVNYHARDWFDSNGQWVINFPVYIDGIFRLPVFARAGAIVPMMPVDEQTKDAFGHLQNGASPEDLIVQVHADIMPSQFTLYEDDGETVEYGTDTRPRYQTRSSVISQQQTNNEVMIKVDKSVGNFPSAVTERNNIVRLVVRDARAVSVKVNGITLPQRNMAASLATAEKGWFNAGRNLVLIKSGAIDVTIPKSFKVSLQPVSGAATVNLVCDKGWTSPVENVYAVGNQTALGNWNPEKAIKLKPSVYYEYIYNPPLGHNGPGPSTPKWTGVVQGLPTNSFIEWKCVKQNASGQWQWEPGDNSIIASHSSGFAGTSFGGF